MGTGISLIKPRLLWPGTQLRTYLQQHHREYSSDQQLGQRSFRNAATARCKLEFRFCAFSQIGISIPYVAHQTGIWYEFRRRRFTFWWKDNVGLGRLKMGFEEFDRDWSVNIGIIMHWKMVEVNKTYYKLMPSPEKLCRKVENLNG